MDKLAKAVRVATIAPFMALGLVTTLYLYDASYIGSLWQYIAMVFFLAVLPALAYPLQPIVPYFKHKGREGQRKLAFVTAGIGYVCGIIFAAVAKAPEVVQIVYWTYFLSAAMLTVFNATTKWKASGHACGVAGPIITLIYFVGLQTLPVVLVFFALCWASLKMKRHTISELILGGIDSILAFLFVLGVSFATA